MAQETTLDLVYEEVRTHLERQMRNLRALDTKANLTAGLSAVVLGIVTSQATGCAQPWARVAWFAAVALLLGAVVLSLLSLWVVGWRADPAPKGMKGYLGADVVSAKRQFLENMVESHRVNRRKLNRKMWGIRLAMVSLLAGLAAVSLVVAVRLIY